MYKGKITFTGYNGRKVETFSFESENELGALVNEKCEARKDYGVYVIFNLFTTSAIAQIITTDLHPLFINGTPKILDGLMFDKSDIHLVFHRFKNFSLAFDFCKSIMEPRK